MNYCYPLPLPGGTFKLSFAKHHRKKITLTLCSLEFSVLGDFAWWLHDLARHNHSLAEDGGAQGVSKVLLQGCNGVLAGHLVTDK